MDKACSSAVWATMDGLQWNDPDASMTSQRHRAKAFLSPSKQYCSLCIYVQLWLLILTLISGYLAMGMLSFVYISAQVLADRATT